MPGTDGLNTLCDTCGIGVSQEDISLFEDEKLSRLKKILELQESSLDISYHCVRCRECLDCKNAEQVEKISLREESELYEIKNSVHLDWEEKKITCTLPLRGIERDFLTSNEDRALRILDSQCRKYFKDEETKASIVAAFQKLIDKGYIQFIDDLPADLQKSFLNKEVQYYLPWRIQFKPESASTSVRPVFDASSRTRKRRDGTGGRCLNDLVCKGPTNSLDLLKVTLRFLIGPIAFAADLTKMYNQFNLKPEQWNLQKLLFREGLDPKAPVQHVCVTTLIYGVCSCTGQTEHTMKEIADHVKEEKPKVAKVLNDGRYVDNVLESTVTKVEAKALAEDTTEVLNRLKLHTKGFSYSGEDPAPKESIDGVTIEINGLRWWTLLDLIEPKVPPLHFGKKVPGKGGWCGVL